MEITLKKWQNILDYYIKCLQKENENNISFYQTGLDLKYFMPFTEECILTSMTGEKKIEAELKKKFYNFILEYRNTSGKFYYGYPIFREVAINKNTGKPYIKINPLLYVEIDIKIVEEEKLITISQSEELPNVNENILSNAGISFTKIDSITAGIEETFIMQNENGDKNAGIKEAIQIIKEICNVEFFTDLDFERFNTDMPIHNNKSYIVNNAMVFHSNDARSAYNKVVIRELEQLKRDELYNQLRKTALSNMFGGGETNEARIKQLLICADINEAQKQAVKSGLENQITVVSGPPGTGKSQVVLNLISSIFVNDLTGLFSSKNNTAVDVIVDYFVRNYSVPVVFRVGNIEYRKRALEKLEELIQNRQDFEIAEEIFKKHWQDYFEMDNKMEKVDGPMKRQLELADEMAENVVLYEKLRVKLDGEEKSWIEKTRLEIENCKRELDKIAKLKNWCNDLIQEENYGIIRWAIQKFFNLLNDKTKMKLITEYNELCVRCNFNLIVGPEWGYADILSTIERKKITLEAYLIRVKLNSISLELGRLPTDEKIVQNLEEDEKRWTEYGARLLDNIIRKRYWKLTEDDKKKIKRYIDVEKILLEPANHEVIGGLKKEESELFSTVKRLLPIWATSSQSGKMFPLEAGGFDVLIIDEASQCDLPSMIPLLFRAKKAIIIGDINQFNHIVGFNTSTDKSIAKSCGVSDSEYVTFSYKNRSIFEYFDREITEKKFRVNLEEHYRSHPHIIKFSNKEFYSGELKIYTKPGSLKIDEGDVGLEWIDIKGETVYPPEGSAYNMQEAEMVFDTALNIVQNQIGKGIEISIGIVTPLKAQKMRIHRIFVERIPQLPENEKKYLERALKGKDSDSNEINYMIDTAHRFQGNERDIMIFSTVASENVKGGTYNFINERRQLNVAITRAKSKLYIVGDFNYCISSISNQSYLGKLAHYVEELNKEINLEYKNQQLESPIEKQLFDELYAEGIEAFPQYKELGYYLDFAIIRGNIKIAIECMGLQFHKKKKSDYIRIRKLRDAGWRVFIFWSWEIMHNSRGCVEKIKEYINEINVNKVYTVDNEESNYLEILNLDKNFTEEELIEKFNDKYNEMSRDDLPNEIREIMKERLARIEEAFKYLKKKYIK